MVNLFKEKRERILNFLKTNGSSSTSRIASTIKSDIDYCRIYLQGLEKEGKIKRKEETQGTYWELI